MPLDARGSPLLFRVGSTRRLFWFGVSDGQTSKRHNNNNKQQRRAETYLPYSATMSADAAATAGGAGDEGGSSMLLNQPIVLDVGTSSIKAGFAGSSKPKVGRKPLGS